MMWEQLGCIWANEQDCVEDFVVCDPYNARVINIHNGATSGKLFAFYCRGPAFDDLRLYRADAKSPTGPFSGECLVSPTTAHHTRLYRSTGLVTAVWPGLPKAGIWSFNEEAWFGVVKRLLIAPKEGTLYSEVAGNPCSAVSDGRGKLQRGTHIFFEGRGPLVDGKCHWRIFHARVDLEAGEVVTVDDEPLWDGANPSLLLWEGYLYLYYSRWNAAGKFDTYVARTAV